MAMLKKQVAITPRPQWVGVTGGFTEQQFVEKRLPTIDEVNVIAPPRLLSPRSPRNRAIASVVRR